MANRAVILTALFVAVALNVAPRLSHNRDYLREMLDHIIAPDPCGDDVIAYYKVDRSFRDVCFGHNAEGEDIQLVKPYVIPIGLAYFEHSKFLVPSLNGYEWGSALSVSLWFKEEGGSSRIRGLINNGARNERDDSSLGSWGIRIVTGSNTNKHHISAFIVTSNSKKTWNNITIAFSNHWHHFVMTFDGTSIKHYKFYLDNHLKLSDSECCYDNIMTTNTDVVIGHTKYKDDEYPYYSDRDGYFNGYIDEVKLFKKALSAREVTKLYQQKTM